MCLVCTQGCWIGCVCLVSRTLECALLAEHWSVPCLHARLLVCVRGRCVLSMANGSKAMAHLHACSAFIARIDFSFLFVCFGHGAPAPSPRCRAEHRSAPSTRAVCDASLARLTSFTSILFLFFRPWRTCFQPTLPSGAQVRAQHPRSP